MESQRNSPGRELLLHEHDKRQKAIDLADSIRATNPDAEVFWLLAQYGNWTERERQRSQQPK